MAARNKDVRRERVVFGFHCRKLGLHITYRSSEPFQSVLKARRTHAVQLNILTVERQADSITVIAKEPRNRELDHCANITIAAFSTAN